MVFALIEAFAPIDHDLFFQFHGMAIFILNGARYNPGFELERRAFDSVAIRLQNPLSFRFWGLADALAHNIALSILYQIAKIIKRMHATVRYQHKPSRLEFSHAPLQCRTESGLIQGVAREGLYGDRDSIIIQKKPHLDNRFFAVFFGNTFLAQPFAEFAVDGFFRIRFLDLEKKFVTS